MRRRVRHRPGPLTGVFLALGLLLLLHALFGSELPQGGSRSVVSGQIAAVSSTRLTLTSASGHGAESLRLAPGTKTVLFQRNGPAVPRSWLKEGAQVRALVETTRTGLVARRIAIRITRVTGLLLGWSRG